MVFEQMLTILLGTAGGVAAVLYAVKPRQTAASIETISLPAIPKVSVSEPAPVARVIAESSPVAEVSTAEVTTISSGTVSTMTIDAPAAVPVAAPAVASPARPVSGVSRAALSARTQRTPRRSSAIPRGQSKNGPPGSARATRRRDTKPPV